MCVIGLPGLTTLLPAEDLLPVETPIGAAIDHYVQARLDQEQIAPADLTDDVTFLRRLSLDLAGRIPTQQELEDYLALPATERRVSAIEALLAQADFAFHHANELDLTLLARIRKDNEWRAYLLEAARENRPWDQIFAEVLLPDVRRPGETGPAAFLRERVRQLDDLTNDTAVLFFGVNIGCAKCHDHPLVSDWEQDHYFGLSAFFKRTYLTKSRLIGEDIEGNVKFTNILGDEKQAAFMFLSSQKVEEPATELTDEERKQLKEAIKAAKNEDKKEAPTAPFSPRAELVSLALQDTDKDFLAKNIVNRIWARLLGRGLVWPLDQMHSENPPSHPELLDWLARDFRENGYDLKRLVAGIVRSDAYARSARWSGSGETPAPDLFAVAEVRPLNPRQLSLSLSVATSARDRLPGLQKPENWEQQRNDLENRANGFADLFPIPEPGFQVGTDEALLISNSGRFENDFLRTSDDRLIGQLKKLESLEERLEAAFRAILSRDPSDEEREAIGPFLAAREDRLDQALQQLTWILLASPEFRFNQ